MPDYDDSYVSGCHGTVAEQLDEAYYDDRSDADDDMEKGRIKFPKNKLYGRDKELGVLRQLYGAMATNNSEERADYDGAAAREGTRISFAGSSPSNIDSRVVFLSGYSGVGKSALVAEFINQIQQEYNNSAANDSSSPVLHFSGKYTQQSSGAAPFSAVSEVFGNIVSSLVNGQQRSEEEKKYTRSLCTKIWKKIQSSGVIGPDTDGNEVLIEIFPLLRPLLDGSFANNNKLQRMESMSNVEDGEKKGEPTMNAVKESTSELLTLIASSLQRPLILFLDDLQWADGPSMELLLFLLANDTQLKNLMFICAYRSNEVGVDHPFANIMTKVTESRGQLVAKVDLFSLSQEAISLFIADSIGMEEVDSVAELVEVIYPKTMGNIFCVMQALEELVRKNALYYDIMCFEWRWTVDKVELANQVSADVVETIKDKIKGLSTDIQRLLSVMAFIPQSVGVPVLKELLMNDEDNSLDENKIASLLKEASEDGMLMWSTESRNYVFSHDRIREASREYVVEEDRDKMLRHMADVLQRLGKGSKMEWCLYTAVDLLNSLPPDKVDVADLIKLNLRVSKIARSRGSPEKENMLLRESLERLQPFKWNNYDQSLEVYNAVIASECNLGNGDSMSTAIDEVLDHAKSLQDKFSAYFAMVQHLRISKDYRTAAHEGVKVLNMYSYNIPLQPTKIDLIREKMKLRLAFKSRSYASLLKLPIIEDPIFELFNQVCWDALFSGQPRLLMVVAWTAIRRAIEKGVERYLPHMLVALGTLLGKKGNIKAANEIGNVALTVSENFRDNKADYSSTRFANYAGIIFYLQSFRSGVDILHQCYKDLRFVGRFEPALGSQLNYIYAYFAAGYQMGTIFESKLLVVDEFCKSIDKSGFAASFQIHRQFAMNLRQRSDHPTLLNGNAFHLQLLIDRADQAVPAGSTHTNHVRVADLFRDETLMRVAQVILAVERNRWSNKKEGFSLRFITENMFGLVGVDINAFRPDQEEVYNNVYLSSFLKMNLGYTLRYKQECCAECGGRFSDPTRGGLGVESDHVEDNDVQCESERKKVFAVVVETGNSRPLHEQLWELAKTAGKHCECHYKQGYGLGSIASREFYRSLPLLCAKDYSCFSKRPFVEVFESKEGKALDECIESMISCIRQLSFSDVSSNIEKKTAFAPVDICCFDADMWNDLNDEGKEGQLKRTWSVGMRRAAGGCYLCDENGPNVILKKMSMMECHHVKWKPGEKKTKCFSPSNTNYSHRKRKIEWLKTVCLCRYCHQLVHLLDENNGKLLDKLLERFDIDDDTGKIVFKNIE